jgi:hypothetical protein
MTSCLQENFLRYKKNTAGNNFPLGLKRKSELVCTSVVPHKKHRRISRYKSVFKKLHACHRVLVEKKLTVDQSITQFPTLFSTDGITALHTHTLSLYMYLYIAHKTAVFCNPHNSSNWDTRFARQLGHKHTPSVKLLYARRNAFPSRKKQTITTCWSVNYLSSCYLFCETVCRRVTTNRLFYCTHNRN